MIKRNLMPQWYHSFSIREICSYLTHEIIVACVVCVINHVQFACVLIISYVVTDRYLSALKLMETTRKGPYINSEGWYIQIQVILWSMLYFLLLYETYNVMDHYDILKNEVIAFIKNDKMSLFFRRLNI